MKPLNPTFVQFYTIVIIVYVLTFASCSVKAQVFTANLPEQCIKNN
jgi:hypothetical protein